MELISSKLINAIGIEDGMGLKEISVDFKKVPRGLIAITGPNGKGKSTFLDGMQPFPCTPSKPKHKLNDIFFDNGSRENVFLMPSGNIYKALLSVDSKLRKSEGFLWLQKGKEWKPVGDANKNIGPYVEELEKILGSQNLFFSSVFRGQKATLFSVKSKGELKEMFEDLLSDLKIIKEHSDLADKIRKHFCDLAQKMIDKIELKLSPFENIEETEQHHKEMLDLVKDLKAKMELQAKGVNDVDKEIKAVEKKIQAQENTVNEIKKLRIDKSNCSLRKTNIETKHIERKVDLDEKITGKTAKRNTTQKIFDNKDEIKKKVEKEKTLSKEVEVFRKRVEEIDKEREKLASKRKEFTNLKLQKADKERFIENDETLTKNAITKLEGEIDRIKSDNKILLSIPCKETAFPDECHFVGDAVKAYEKIETLQKELEDLKEPSEDIVKLKTDIEGINEELKECDKIEKQDKDLATEKIELGEYISQRDEEILEVKRWTKLIAQAEIAEATIKELNNEIIDLDAEKQKEIIRFVAEDNNLAKEIKGIDDTIIIKESKINNKLELELSELEENKEEEEDTLKKLREDLLDDQKTIGALESKIEDSKTAKKETAELQKRLDWFNKEIAEWSQLQIACGRERGIIPMEIDDAGPKVSALSNDLLTQCFGTRYTIRIVTIQPKKKGKGLKEVFDIRIIDSERLKEKSLIDMSGGQEVWINLAIMLGIALYNRENANLKTLWLDEMDGALDADSKINFLAMLRRVLDVGGFNRVFFISHTPELFKAADARLVLGDGGVKVDL